MAGRWRACRWTRRWRICCFMLRSMARRRMQQSWRCCCRNAGWAGAGRIWRSGWTGGTGTARRGRRLRASWRRAGRGWRAGFALRQAQDELSLSGCCVFRQTQTPLRLSLSKPASNARPTNTFPSPSSSPKPSPIISPRRRETSGENWLAAGGRGLAARSRIAAGARGMAGGGRGARPGEGRADHRGHRPDRGRSAALAAAPDRQAQRLALDRRRAPGRSSAGAAARRGDDRAWPRSGTRCRGDHGVPDRTAARGRALPCCRFPLPVWRCSNGRASPGSRRCQRKRCWPMLEEWLAPLLSRRLDATRWPGAASGAAQPPGLCRTPAA